MKIVADENMPFVEDLFSDSFEVVTVNGRTLSATDIQDADVVLVRSVTEVNKQLLVGNETIKFIGTATIGTNHIDQTYLQQRNIAFSSAPGCNAIAVGEYAFIAMLELAEKFSASLKDKVVGIVGAGNTGTALANCLAAYGVNTLLCDPIKQQQGDGRDFFSLEHIITACDIISLHVPLTNNGANKTWHLFDEQRLQQLKPNTWLLNCCRGEVIDNQALLKFKQYRDDVKLVLDVWENEPNPLAELIPHCELATPHIAGYSIEGKARGTYMLYQQVCMLFKLPIKHAIEDLLPEYTFSDISLNHQLQQRELLRLSRLVYDIRDDDRKFRKLDFKRQQFDKMRKSHKHRREFSAVNIEKSNQFTIDWLGNLGFRLGNK